MEAYTNTVGVRLLDLPYHLDREYSYYVPETLCFSAGDQRSADRTAGSK